MKSDWLRLMKSFQLWGLQNANHVSPGQKWCLRRLVPLLLALVWEGQGLEDESYWIMKPELTITEQWRTVNAHDLSTTGTCKAGLRGNTRSELIDLCWDVKHEHTLRRGGLYIKRFCLALFCCAWLVILGGPVARHVPAVEMAASKALAAILQQTHKWS